MENSLDQYKKDTKPTLTLKSIHRIARVIVADELIYKEGLTITYDLNPINHEALQRELYTELNKNLDGKLENYVSSNIFEFSLYGITFILKR
jgi:hypothetical protein